MCLRLLHSDLACFLHHRVLVFLLLFQQIQHVVSLLHDKRQKGLCVHVVCVCVWCVCVRVNHVFFLGCLKSGVTHSFPRVEDLSQLCYHNSNLTLKFVKPGKEIKPSHLTA